MRNPQQHQSRPNSPPLINIQKAQETDSIALETLKPQQLQLRTQLFDLPVNKYSLKSAINIRLETEKSPHLDTNPVKIQAVR